MKISKNVLSFLSELKINNNRDLFLENKKRFNEIQSELIILSGYFLSEIGKFDKTVKGVDPKSCIFRIYKDVRFSKDKRHIKLILGFLTEEAVKNRWDWLLFTLGAGRIFIVCRYIKNLIMNSDPT